MAGQDAAAPDTADQDTAGERPVLIQITVPNRHAANAISTALVERRLAAAVHVAEVDAVYRWQDVVHQGAELVLTAKTLAARFAAIKTLVDDLHPYELPPLLQIDITQTTPDYAAWIAGNADGT